VLEGTPLNQNDEARGLGYSSAVLQLCTFIDVKYIDSMVNILGHQNCAVGG